MRVLLIEDNELVSELIRTGFENAGWQVESALDCTTASGFLAQRQYDAVVLEIELPDGDGLSILNDVRARSAYLPVIMLTACAGPDAAVNGLVAGADDHVAKPFDMAELVARLLAVSRRTSAGGHEILQFGDISFNRLTREATWAGHRVRLTPIIDSGAISSAQPDRAMIERLRSEGGDVLVRRMLRLFLVTSADAFHRIDTALESGRLSVVATAAHHLRSSAAQLRFTQIAQIAERIENNARSENAEELQQDVARLSDALGMAVSALHVELEALPKPARIAVIDDSEDVRVLLRLVLERHYDVSEYSTGSSALLGLQRFPVDLLMIDFNLPDMSGIDLLNFIRADSRLQRIPAIALTALLPDGGRTYLDAGFDLHIRKPILDTDEVLASINHFLETDQDEWA